MRTSTSQLPFEARLFGTLSEREQAVLASLRMFPEPALAFPPGGAGERELDADVLRAFCHHPEVLSRIDSGGIVISNVRVRGQLDLAFCRIPFRLQFIDCTFLQPLLLHHARVPHLVFRGGRVAGIRANGLRVDGDLEFGGAVRIYGCVELRNAFVGGELRFSTASLGRPSRPRGRGRGVRVALVANGCRVNGHVLLNDGFRAAGEVTFAEAMIGGSFDCRGGRFHTPAGQALAADRVRVGGAVRIGEGFLAFGEVAMTRARIRGDLDCGAARIITRRARGAKASANGKPFALSLDGARIGGSLRLNARGGPGNRSRPFTARGQVRLVGVTIRRDLDARGAHFSHLRRAVYARQVRVDGSVYLDEGLRCQGAIAMTGAAIGGDLLLESATLAPPDGAAGDDGELNCGLLANYAHVGGEIRVGKGTRVCGTINIAHTVVSRDVVVSDVEFSGVAENGLRADQAAIGGRLHWRDLSCGPATVLNLTRARAGGIESEASAWPRPGKLTLRGFVYSAIDLGRSAAPDDEEAGGPLWRRMWRAVKSVFPLYSRSIHVRWLRRQFGNGGDAPFDPQPYEQLARILRRGGSETEAKSVAIARCEHQRKYGQVGWGAWTKSAFLGLSIRHGYSSVRVFAAAVALMVLGGFAFDQGREAMAGLGSGQRPAFSPYAYSVDAFLPPIAALSQEAYWHPVDGEPCTVTIRGGAYTVARCGRVLRIFLWVQVALGWALTSLLVVSFTGLMRKS